MESEKSVYLLGAFGGVAGAICDSFFDGAVAPPLTEAWQLENNCGYGDLQTWARADNRHADYDLIEKLLSEIDRGVLADRAGLNQDEYCRLMRSPFVDECVHLILRGLCKISRG